MPPASVSSPSAAPVRPAAPAVRIDGSGRVIGAVRDDLMCYLGVPYAAPLVGERRFAPPAPPDPWEGERACTAPGPAAFQVGTAGHIGRGVVTARPQGAESLTLNIRTRDLDGGKPVLVWFHGGGLFAGSNAEPALTTGAFAADGIVEVTVNYRLGLYGYLDLGDGSIANRGLLDQVAALRWVRRHIASFGGDPGRVTIGGHSAGGFACAELMASPLADGLFHQVFLGSGAGSARHTPETAATVRRLTFDRLGVRDPAGLAGLGDAELLAGQQDLIDECYTTMPARFGHASVLGLPFEHTIDGVSVVRDVARTLAAGARPGMPLLVGTTTGESVAHVSRLPDDLSPENAAEAYDGMVAPLGVGGAEVVDAYRRLLPGVSAKGVLAAVNADLRFTLDSIRAADAQAPHGPVYRFVIGEDREGWGGVTPHGAVQGHAWRTRPGLRPPQLKPQQQPLSERAAALVHTAVSSFVHTGRAVSEDGETTFAWPTVDRLDPDRVLRIRTAGHEVATDPARRRLGWWGDRVERAR